MKIDDNLEEIEKHLDHERDILRQGRLSELEPILQEKERFITILQGYDGDRTKLQRLRSKAEHNAELLKSCETGIRRALLRLRELQIASGPIASYSAEGSPEKIGKNKPEFEIKA